MQTTGVVASDHLERSSSAPGGLLSHQNLSREQLDAGLVREACGATQVAKRGAFSSSALVRRLRGPIALGDCRDASLIRHRRRGVLALPSPAMLWLRRIFLWLFRDVITAWLTKRG